MNRRAPLLALPLLLLSVLFVAGCASDENAPPSTQQPDPVVTEPDEPGPTDPGPPVSTTSYYLDSSKGNDGHDGTRADAAWRTLQPLRNLDLHPGDRVLFRRGSTWDTGYAWGQLSTNLGLEITAAGTAEHPVVFGAYGEEGEGAPVLTNSYSELIHENGLYTRVFTVSGSHIRIEDLLFENAREAGIYVTAQASHVHVNNIESRGHSYGVVLAGTHNTVSNSHLHGSIMLVSTPGGDDDSGATGILVMGSHNTIVDNVIENNLSWSFDYHTDGSAIELFSTGNLISHITVARNVIRNNDTVMELGGSGSHPAFSHVTFAYNLMENNSRMAVIHNGGGNFGSRISDIAFHHNTVYENTAEWDDTEWGGIAAERGKYALIWTDQEPGGTFAMHNNILHIQGLERIANHETFARSHNLYFLGDEMDFRGLGAMEMHADPRFVSTAPENRDFRLQPGSPAIDAGMAGLGYEQDLAGTSVPQGGAPDLGAYEFRP